MTLSTIKSISKKKRVLVFGNLGLTYQQLGDPRKAIEY